MLVQEQHMHTLLSMYSMSCCAMSRRAWILSGSSSSLQEQKFSLTYTL